MLNSSFLDMSYAFMLTCLFVFSLFFGWTILLIYMLIPRGTHRIHRASRCDR